MTLSIHIQSDMNGISRTKNINHNASIRTKEDTKTDLGCPYGFDEKKPIPQCCTKCPFDFAESINLEMKFVDCDAEERMPGKDLNLGQPMPEYPTLWQGFNTIELGRGFNHGWGYSSGYGSYDSGFPSGVIASTVRRFDKNNSIEEIAMNTLSTSIKTAGFEEVLDLSDFNRRDELNRLKAQIKARKKDILQDEIENPQMIRQLLADDPVIINLTRQIKGLEAHLRNSEIFRLKEESLMVAENKKEVKVAQSEIEEMLVPEGEEMTVSEGEEMMVPEGEELTVDEQPEETLEVSEDKELEKDTSSSEVSDSVMVNLKKTPKYFAEQIEDIPQWSRDNMLSVRYALDYLENTNNELNAIITDENYELDYKALKSYNKVQTDLDGLINEMSNILKAVEGEKTKKASVDRVKIKKEATTPRSMEVVDPFISKITRKVIRRVITDGKEVKQAVSEMKDLFKLSDRDVAHVILQMEDFGFNMPEEHATGRFLNDQYYA